MLPQERATQKPKGQESASQKQRRMDQRLGDALRSGSPADIAAAYQELADFHFEQRNMAAADELYAFSALHEAAGLPPGDRDGSMHFFSSHPSSDQDRAQPGALQFPDHHEGSNASCVMTVSPRSQHPTPRGENPCTTLSVTVLEAQHLGSLPAMGGASKSLFCTVSLECPGKTSITARTELVPHADEAKWNARFEFRIDDVAVNQGVVNVAIMERRIFAPAAHLADTAGDYPNKLELAVSRIGVVRSIRLHQIYSGNGTLQRWFTVAPAPEQEVGSAVMSPTSRSCCLALMLQTSDKIHLASRNSTPTLLSPSNFCSPASTPLLSPRPRSRHGEDGIDAGGPGAAVLEERLLQLCAPSTDPNADIALLKRSLMSDMALLKRSLERKPEGKVWFESPAVIAITLSDSFDEVSASQDTRRRFQDGLAEDIATALSLARRQILVFGLRRGSVIATIGILVPGGGPSASELAAELRRQLEDASSALLHGRITRRATKVTLLDNTQTGSPASGKNESEASGSPIVMASPRPPVVFESAVPPSPLPSEDLSAQSYGPNQPVRKASAPQSDVPVNLGAPWGVETQQSEGRHGSPWAEQDGAHNPKAALAFPQQEPLERAASNGHHRRTAPLSGKPAAGPEDELGSILSARKKQVDQATGLRRTSPDTAGSAGPCFNTVRSDVTRANSQQAPADSERQEGPSARRSIDLSQDNRLSMYGQVESPANVGRAGASLGLGRVEYEDDKDKAWAAAASPPVPIGHSLQRKPAAAPLPAGSPGAPSAHVLAQHQHVAQHQHSASAYMQSGQQTPSQSASAGLQVPRASAAKSSSAGLQRTAAVPLVVAPLPVKWKDAKIKTIVYGTIAHTPRFGDIEVLEEAVVLVDSGGQILLVATQDMVQESEILAWAQRFSPGTCTPVVQSKRDSGQHMDVISMARGQVLVPGFIDTHIHAPQYPYTGTATDKPLMLWLNQYTFPAEQRLADESVAARVYSAVVDRTLRGGTTTALYFATIHVRASKILADIAVRKGQRAFIGKVCMDRNSPAEYSETTAEALAGTEDFIQYVRSLHTELVQPVVTPRFIPTCTPELLRGLGDLAHKYNCHIQSHISESQDEMQFVSDLHPNEGSDADIFDKHGLLTDKCVMAHGVHLSRDDADLLRTRGTAVAHCPLSNFFFGDGVLATAKLVAMGNKVGLGSDVAGGYCPCMLSSIRNAVVADRAVRHGGRHSLESLASSYASPAHRSGAILAAGAEHKSRLERMPDKMDWRHALYLATLGGAVSLGIEDQVGTIEVGKSFDALLLEVAGGGIDIFETETKRDILEKLVNLGTEHNVSKVWVNGRSVHHKPVYRGPQRLSHPSSPRISSNQASPSRLQPFETDTQTSPSANAALPLVPELPAAPPQGQPVLPPLQTSTEPSPPVREGAGLPLPAGSASLALVPNLVPNERHSAGGAGADTDAALPVHAAWATTGEQDARAPLSKFDSFGSGAADVPMTRSADEPPEPQDTPPRPLMAGEEDSSFSGELDADDLQEHYHSFSETEDDVGAC